ncbi:MAG: hypothetical protein KGJ70_12710 [Gemmatimonadota bacterium]|nr:hypothetical protein [Gemmatimonadota bacterium]
MRRAVAIGLAFAATAGCHRARSGGAPAPAPGDTLRGTFVLEGADPMPAAVLRTPSGRVALDGVPAGMQALVQLELWVRGSAESNGRFRVDEFLVRGAGGEPAWDGVVERAGAGFELRLSDGAAHPLIGSPAAFAELVGTRVWVTETAAHTVASYGVIR